MADQHELSATDNRPLSRQSNMELLRIIAMTMILYTHILSHGILGNDLDSSAWLLFASPGICGVNLFFMISGYFRIRLSKASLLKIILLVLVYDCISIGVTEICAGGISFKSMVKAILFPVTGSNYWFLKAYLGLMFLVPFINYGIDVMPRRSFRHVMILFTVFTIYSCGFGQNLCNSNGFTFGQAIYMYCLAQWIRSEHEYLARFSGKLLLAVHLLAIAAISAAAYVFHNGIFLHYNNFLVVIASACLFILFTRISFHNNLVNRIATAALGCYLLQDGYLGSVIYPWQHNLAWSDSTIMLKILIFAACFIGFWLASYIITRPADAVIRKLIAALPARWQLSRKI